MWKIVRMTAPLLLLIAIIVGVLVLPIVSEPSSSVGLGKVEEAWQVIVNDFVDKNKIDQEALSTSAIKGMIEALHDPYTTYYDAAEFKRIEQTRIEGSYGGIGAVVTISDGNLTVVSLFEGAPAEKAGIKPKDRILKIDGASTVGMSLDEAVLKIQGKAGTQVTLEILHEGEVVPVTVVVTREEIKVPSVHAEVLTEEIAHIEITYFTTNTGSEMVSALEEVLRKNVKGVILDLRDNPGGPVDAAVSVASQFLKEGIVLYAVDSDGKKETWNVKAGGMATELPLAVLVNQNSASASEVVAGALQDYERGALVGTKTFGKGSINHFRQLSDGSAIYISIGRWYTPKGRQIEGNGLVPDIVVQRNDEDAAQGKDPQLDKAIEYIQGQL